MKCAIALIGAVTTAIRRTLRSLENADAVWKRAFLVGAMEQTMGHSLDGHPSG